MADGNNSKYCSLKMIHRPYPVDEKTSFYTFQISVSLGISDAKAKFDGIRIIFVQKEPHNHEIVIREGVYSRLLAIEMGVKSVKPVNSSPYRSHLSEQRRRESAVVKSPFALVLEVYELEGDHPRSESILMNRTRMSLRTLPQLVGEGLFRILGDSTRSLEHEECSSLSFQAQIINILPSMDGPIQPTMPTMPIMLAEMDEPFYSFRIWELGYDRPQMPILPPVVLEKIVLYAVDHNIFESETIQGNWVSVILKYGMVSRQWLCVRDLFWKLLGSGANLPWASQQTPPVISGLPPSITPELAPLLRKFKMNDSLPDFRGFTPMDFARVYLEAAENLQNLSKTPDIFWDVIPFLKKRRFIETLDLRRNAGRKGTIKPTWTDLMGCIEEWQVLESLSINLILLEQQDRGIEFLVPPGYRPQFRLRDLNIVGGQPKLMGPQLLALFPGPQTQLTSLSLLGVMGLTNEDIWNLFSIVYPTLEKVEIKRCKIEPPMPHVHPARSEYALDAFIRSMTRVFHAEVDGDMMTSRTITRKRRSDGRPSLLVIRTPYRGLNGCEDSLHPKVSPEAFLSAMKESGWEKMELKDWPGRYLDWRQAHRVARKSGVNFNVVLNYY